MIIFKLMTQVRNKVSNDFHQIVPLLENYHFCVFRCFRSTRYFHTLNINL